MFKSKEVNESQFLKNVTLTKLNETCNGLPKITSTPVNAHNSSSQKGKLVLSPTSTKPVIPRRYSLSEASPSPSRKITNTTASNSPGPLLASLSFRDNVSRYEETKSSGLARRIVLYNEEAEQQQHLTHQEKYSSPGLFPIVHLFKKKPGLEQSPKRVKIKLGSSEYIRSFPSQHVLDGPDRPIFQRQQSLPLYSQIGDTNSKSVLDALKEISRKRIHSGEDNEHSGESGKRIRTEFHNGSSATNKRNRTESPLLDSSEGSPSSKQSQKKFCVYDEFAASKSSSDFSFLTKAEPLRLKRKTTSTSTESFNNNKQAKLVDVKTQTVLRVNEDKTQESAPLEKAILDKPPKTQECQVQVFDHAPLNRIRKSRLAALMGNLAGKDAVLPIKSVKSTLTTNETKELDKASKALIEVDSEEREEESAKPVEETPKESKIDKPLVSALASPKSSKESSPEKSSRHVQFAVTTSNSIASQQSITQTSTSIVTPIASDSGSQPLVSLSNEKTEIPTSNSSENNAETLSSPSLVTSISSSINPSPNFSTLDKVITTENSATNITSSKKAGGFKFDLTIPSTISTPSSSSAPVFDSPADSQTNMKSSNDLGQFPASGKDVVGFTFKSADTQRNMDPSNFGGDLSKSQSLNFGSAISTTSESNAAKNLSFASHSSAISQNKSADSTGATYAFGSNTTTSDVKTCELSEQSIHESENKNSPTKTGNSIGGFTFGSRNVTPNADMAGGFKSGSIASKFGSLESNTVTTSTTLGSSAGTSTVTSSGMTFGTKVSSGFVEATKSPTPFVFGGTTSAFGSNKPNATFGSVEMTTPSFGVSTNNNISSTTPTSVSANSSVPAFGITPNAKPTVVTSPMTAFGSSPSVTSSLFGNTPSSNMIFGAAATTTSSSGFGASGTISTPSFGSSVFGTPTTASLNFGTTPASTVSSVFGTAPAAVSVFGTTSHNTVTTTGGFGSFTSPSTFTFKGTTPSTTSAFGGTQSTFTSNPTTTAASFSFGSTNTSTFGNGVFGLPSTTASNPPSFAPSAFGRTNTTVASNATPAFGTPTFSFGSDKPTATANPFGSSTTTTSSATFGTANTSFPSTGALSSAPAFGTSVATFGSTASSPGGTFGSTSAAPAFSQTENKLTFTFGATPESKSSSTFGSGTGQSAFGKPANSHGGFGSTAATSFGSKNTSGFGTQQASGGFNFTSSTSTSSASPFAFGSSATATELPKPTFNFTGGATNPPTFGVSGNTPTFGGTAPNFGAQATPFGTTGSPAAGVFNIGAGSSTVTKPRQLSRIKRKPQDRFH